MDFVCFNVYLHQPQPLKNYLARLQMLAESKPLLLGEFGMDSLRELHLWHRVEELLRLCAFITVERPGIDRPVSPDELRLPSPWPERLLAGVIRGRLCEVSSREIHKRVAENRPIRYLVTPAVEQYILRQGLYSGHAAVQGGDRH